MNSTRISGRDGIEVDMNMDYRYFFLNNKLYYDELSTMSLLLSNSIYMHGDKQEEHSGVKIKSGNNFSDEKDTKEIYNYDIIEMMDYDKFKNLQVKEMMEHFGFKNVRTYYLGSPGDLGDENREYFLKNFKEIDKKTKEPTGRIDLNKLEKDTNYKKIGTKYKNKDEIYLGYRDTHKGRVAIGYKNIEYHGLYKTVVGIVVRGTSEDDDWDSDFDVGDKELMKIVQEKYIGGSKNYNQNYEKILQQLENGILDRYDPKYSEELMHFAGGYPDWTNIQHHAGFDIVANRILEIINSYYSEFKDRFDEDREELDDNNETNLHVPHKETTSSDDEVCFWVMGHSMGAGVANLIGANLVNADTVVAKSKTVGEKLSSPTIDSNENNVYCYAFATPNNFYKIDNIYERESKAIPTKKIHMDYTNPKSVKYRCIFNIVNDDDFVPKLPMEDCGWTKYGRVAVKSVKEDARKHEKELGVEVYFNESDGTYMYKHYGMPAFLATYNGSPKVSQDIADSATNMYKNKNEMRNESYIIDSELRVNHVAGARVDLDRSFFRYALPFQKNEIVGSFTVNNLEVKMSDVPDSRVGYNIYVQKMSPEYLFIALASTLHGYDDYDKTKTVNNNFKFFTIDLPDKLYQLKKAFICLKPKDFNLNVMQIQHPHYVESYYVLTKFINTTDFN